MAAVSARYATLRETVEEYHFRLAEAIDAGAPGGEGGDKENAGGEHTGYGEQSEEEEEQGVGACAALRAEAHRPGETPATGVR
jgi:hypothetical protein